MKLKGYIFSRPFMGERVPQHIQNIVIRNYCSNNNHIFFLSASEYTMDQSFHILKQIVDSSENIDGIVAYSLFQMPEDLSFRNKIFDKMISKNIVTSDFKIKSVRVVIDKNLPVDENYFRNLLGEITDSKIYFTFIKFSQSKEDISSEKDCYDANHISFFGNFKDKLAKACNRKVDLQINFFGNDNLYLKWIAIKGENKLSFGFRKTDIRVNDVIFDFLPLQTDIFKN